MRSSLIALAILLAGSTHASGGAESQSSVDMVAWLEGDWVRQTKRGVVTESWERVSPHTMEGVVSITSGDATHITEHLRIESLGDELFYVAKPGENPFPTPFKLIESDEMLFAFENPKHDFPQRILYRWDGEDGLVVRIEGPGDGGERAIDFQFERKK